MNKNDFSPSQWPEDEEMVKAPAFYPGVVICSALFVGKVEYAFRDEGTWLYGIGENASIGKNSSKDRYAVGGKIVSEDAIIFWLRGNEWVRA